MLSMKKAPAQAVSGETNAGAPEGMSNSIRSSAFWKVPARVISYQKATCQGSIVAYGGLSCLTHGEGWGSVKAPYPDEVLQTPFRSPKERKKHKKSIAAHTCEISYPRLDSILWVVCLYWQACIVQYPRGLVASSGQGSVTGLPLFFNPYPDEVPFHD